ncbi:VIT domain-containing protein [Dokdonia sp.]|uniref:VIT domain-containing protein n=1 Tax=Dokdonia sp. TaxID=2024995 RepID=UPI0032669D2E
MKNAVLLWLICLCTISYAQKIPVVKVDNKPLGLSSLKVDVVVTGNIATTTYDMLFYNPTTSILEGELDFPLGDGFSVSRFALDINGKLREAVVVDKELGRIAFEAVVRRRVDPALLEKGTGNNYKARIYPIPAKGHKRIVLAYEQELKLTEGKHYYDLPLAFQNELENFDLSITVLDQATKPVIEKGAIKGLGFTPWQRNYKSTLHKEHFTPNTSIRIQIPIETKAKQLRDQEYVYMYTAIDIEKRQRIQPDEVTLFWDTSLSMKERDLDKEIALLNTYFKQLGSVKVHLVTYSNTIQIEKSFVIKNGNWDTLQHILENTTYDGGTDYSILSSRSVRSGVTLLSTDGMYTLSELDMYSSVPAFTINSVVKSNHPALRKLANDTQGGYIDLTTTTTNEALKVLSEQSFKFLGYTTSNKTAEIYPKTPQVVSNDFSIAAKGVNSGDRITLQFGYNNKVSKEISIEVDDAFAKSDIIKRLWAKKKLDVLAEDSKDNKEAITTLGTSYQLVTDYTSLIVLDDVMDYVRYKITPPAELLEAYNRILAQVEASKDKESERKKMLRRAVESARAERSSTFRNSEMNNLAPPPIPETIEIVEVEEMVEESISYQFSASPNAARYDGLGIDDEDVDHGYREVESSALDLALSNGAVPFATIGEPPMYPGCEDVISKKECVKEKIGSFVRENFRESVYANEQELLPGIARIYVQFEINKKGAVKNIRVRAPNQALEDEATRVIQLLPKMKPGMQDGKKVSVIYNLPITVTIPDNGQTPTTPVDVTPRYTKYSGKLIVKDRRITTPYLKELREIKNVEKAYEYYLIQRISYKDVPAYFIDVANFFKDSFNHQVYARRIVSNIPEIDGDNYELLKVFGYQMQLEDAHEIAAFVFQRILELRPEDSQSYRDLALAYENIGKCQEALDLLMSIVDGSIYKNNQRRIFEGVKTISENEIKHLIGEYKNDLKLDSIPTHYKDASPMDIRVVVDWNHNDTDIDLHIIDPNLEECYYSHNRTAIGGKMSQDMTQGFGPEEYTVQNAVKGDYYIKVKYYGSRYQKVETPTFMKVTVFKYFGTNKETKETQIIRLVKADNEEIVAKLSF